MYAARGQLHHRPTSATSTLIAVNAQRGPSGAHRLELPSRARMATIMKGKASAAEEGVRTCRGLCLGLDKARVHTVAERRLGLYRLDFVGPTALRSTGGHGDDIW